MDALKKVQARVIFGQLGGGGGGWYRAAERTRSEAEECGQEQDGGCRRAVTTRVVTAEGCDEVSAVSCSCERVARKTGRKGMGPSAVIAAAGEASREESMDAAKRYVPHAMYSCCLTAY